MRLQGWVSLGGSLSSSLVRSLRHVRPLSRSGGNMAEEAKKLAAYAAVDNHVQVPSSLIPPSHHHLQQKNASFWVPAPCVSTVSQLGLNYKVAQPPAVK